MNEAGYKCGVLTGARCNVSQTMSCADIDCPVWMAAARGDYGPSLKFQVRSGRIRYIAGGGENAEAPTAEEET